MTSKADKEREKADSRRPPKSQMMRPGLLTYKHPDGSTEILIVEHICHVSIVESSEREGRFTVQFILGNLVTEVGDFSSDQAKAMLELMVEMLRSTDRQAYAIGSLDNLVDMVVKQYPEPQIVTPDGPQIVVP